MGASSFDGPAAGRSRRRRLVAALAGPVLAAVLTSGCTGAPVREVGAASPVPSAGPTGDAGTAATSTPDPTRARTPTPEPTPTRLPAMTQPRKPYPSPTPRPLPTNPSELDHMKWAMEKVVWAALGQTDPDTSAFCTTLSKTLVNATDPVHFTCRVDANGVTTRFTVVAERKNDEIAYRFTADKLPVTRAKVDYEAARQVFDPARIHCDVTGTELVRVGDPDEIACWVRHPNRTRTRYYGELDRYGVLTFRTEQQLQALASPSPAATKRPKATRGKPARPKAKTGTTARPKTGPGKPNRDSRARGKVTSGSGRH